MSASTPDPTFAFVWPAIRHDDRHYAHFGRPAPLESFMAWPSPAPEHLYYPSVEGDAKDSTTQETLDLAWADAACTVEQAHTLATYGGGMLHRLETNLHDHGSYASGSQASPNTETSTDSPSVMTPPPHHFGSFPSPSTAFTASWNHPQQNYHAHYSSEADWALREAQAYLPRAISPQKLVLASDPSDTRITPPSLLSLSSSGSPVILTPQPRHPVETVQRLLHRYLAGPPSPERSYEARREEALVNYQARLAAVPPAVTQPDREQTSFDTSGSHLQSVELPYQSASDTFHHGAGAVQHQHQHVPAVGRGIFIPSSVDATGNDNLDPSGPPRKPTIMACLFCRGRKIACNAPPPGSADRTCTQCAKRNQPCVYPTVCRRGQKRPAPPPENTQLTVPARPKGSTDQERVSKRARQ